MSSLNIYKNLEACEERRDGDFYPTPWEAIESLARSEEDEIRGKHIWEPACGDGAISEHLKNYYQCKVFSTDLVDRGYGTGGIDFILTRRKAVKYNRIITNPPFVLAEEFIRKCMKLKLSFCALLLKSHYYHADCRIGLFNEFPPSRVYPIGWRVDFTGGGANHLDCSWFVWKRPFQGFTEYMPPLEKKEFVKQQGLFDG